jgi:hypothetical protein
LLSYEKLESSFWNKERWGQSARVLDSSLDIFFAEVLEWVNVIDDLIKHIVEDVVDSGTSSALNRDIFDKSSVDNITISILELV